jgi:ABC-type sugar transport system ATPase subunit
MTQADERVSSVTHSLEQAHPAAGGATPIVSVRGIRKFYGHVEALRGVDLDLMPGEVHALVGDNGAGKSTLVKIIAGAIQATEGEVLLDGRPVHFTEPREALEAGISTVYQGLALVGCRSIAANLFLGREPSRFGFVRSREMNAKAEEMLTELRQLNITEIHAEVDDLSGGQRQAVAIARGVRLGQRVLILDEPTAALGVREAAGVLELIKTLRGSQRTLLLISHNLQHVFDVSDRITVLRAGRKVGTVRRDQATSDQIVSMITGSSEAA